MDENTLDTKSPSVGERPDAGTSPKDFEIENAGRAIVLILVMSGVLIYSAGTYAGLALAGALIAVDCVFLFAVFPMPKGPLVRTFAWLSLAGALWYLTQWPVVYFDS